VHYACGGAAVVPILQQMTIVKPGRRTRDGGVPALVPADRIASLIGRSGRQQARRRARATPSCRLTARQMKAEGPASPVIAAVQIPADIGPTATQSIRLNQGFAWLCIA
jgi:hypothetical protein